MLRERAERWPYTSNPHLLITQQSAIAPHGPAMSRTAMKRLPRPLGLSASQLRMDRILDEAAESADPIRPNPSMRPSDYSKAAKPTAPSLPSLNSCLDQGDHEMTP